MAGILHPGDLSLRRISTKASSVTIDSLNICHARKAALPRSAEWKLERRLEQQSEQAFESCAQNQSSTTRDADLARTDVEAGEPFDNFLRTERFVMSTSEDLD